MHISKGNLVRLVPWERLNHDGILWEGIEKRTYIELSEKPRIIESVNVDEAGKYYRVKDDFGNVFYIDDRAIDGVYETPNLAYGIIGTAVNQLKQGTPDSQFNPYSLKGILKSVFISGYSAGKSQLENPDQIFESLYKTLI